MVSVMTIFGSILGQTNKGEDTELGRTTKTSLNGLNEMHRIQRTSEPRCT